MPLMNIPTAQSHSAPLYKRCRNQCPKGYAERKRQQYAMFAERVSTLRPWRFRMDRSCPHFSLSSSGSLNRRVWDSLYGTLCKDCTKL